MRKPSANNPAHPLTSNLWNIDWKTITEDETKKLDKLLLQINNYIKCLLRIVIDDCRMEERLVEADTRLDVNGLNAAQGRKVVEDAGHGDARRVWNVD